MTNVHMNARTEKIGNIIDISILQDPRLQGQGLKKNLVGGWWSPSENSVCPHPLLQFLQFMLVRLHQFTSEGRDVELDNKKL